MNQAKEKRLQFTEKAQQIVDRMTLEEKVYLMSGNLSLQDMMADAMGEASHYNAKPYPAGGNEKEGVAPMLFCDGPRGVVCGTGESTCFPVTMCRGASFDAELEEEIGFSIFTRSSRGVIPTEKGREFLALAKRAVKQYQALENYCTREERDNISLHICVPRASYITCALTSFLSKNARGRQLSVNYNETGTLDAISHVSDRSASMAIIRYPDRYEKTLLPLLKLRELSYETLYKFELVVIMSERHPLAKTSVLTQDLLSQAVEIVCDDTSLCTYLHESPDADHNENSIHIHERGSQFDFLTGVPGTFMFVSPVPDSVLSRYHLVQKKFQGSPRKSPVLLIYPGDYRPSRGESAFREMRKESVQ